MAAGSNTARGFTLLEAIVALTIMAMALVPLLAFISQTSNEILHAADTNERSMAMQSAIAVMGPVNPMLAPEGQLDLDDNLTISWHSDTLVKPNDVAMVGGGLASFRLGFYVVHVTLLRNANQPWFTFDMRKIGYDRFGLGSSPFAPPS